MAGARQVTPTRPFGVLADHKPDIERASKWLREHVTAIGLKVSDAGDSPHHMGLHTAHRAIQGIAMPVVQGAKIIPTEGPHPVVYAEWLGAAGKPTVLIYGHYDVQPVSDYVDVS